MEDLSSKLTFFFKFVFPAFWIGMFVGITLLMFLGPDSFEGDGDVREVRWVFVGATIAGTGFIYWSCMRVKRISLVGHEFIISNYRRTLRVPLRDVERVSSSVLMQPELIWLHFRRPTEFGTRVVFMPKQRALGGFTRHPLARRLSDLVVSPGVIA